MNTEKMSHIVSMTANVGVLIGLSLLVYELDQNNQHLQEQAETVALQIRMQTTRAPAENVEIGRLIYSDIGGQPLNEVDVLRRQYHLRSVLVEWQWMFERERTGLIKQFDSLDHMASSLRSGMQRLKFEDEWHARKNEFRADFREFMDTQVLGPG